MSVFASVYGCVLVNSGGTGEVRALDPPGAAAAGSWGLPDAGPGNLGLLQEQCSWYPGPDAC